MSGTKEYTLIDSKGLKENNFQGAHIKRFLRNHGRQDINFLLETDAISGIHVLSYRGQIFAEFNDGWMDTRYYSPFYKNELVLTSEHLPHNMFYFRKIFSHILFFKMLAYNDQDYQNYAHFFSSDNIMMNTFFDKDEKADIFSRYNFIYSGDNKFPFSIVDYNLNLVYKWGFNKPNDRYNFTIEDRKSMKDKSTHHIIPFLKGLSKELYRQIVKPHIDIEPEYFKREHANLVGILKV